MNRKEVGVKLAAASFNINMTYLIFFEKKRGSTVWTEKEAARLGGGIFLAKKYD